MNDVGKIWVYKIFERLGLFNFFFFKFIKLKTKKFDNEIVNCNKF